MLHFLILSLAITQVDGLGSGDHIRKLTIADQERTYFVHVPKGYDGTKPYPVVLVFHGGGSNARQWISFCGMNEKADQVNFIAVYPNGAGKTINHKGQTYEVFGWNGGPRQPGGETKVDDVGFTRALLDDLSKVVKVDAKRVYATGMSMGAIMVYRLASELSDRIAAIAPVAGPMGTEKCDPKQPVSVLHIHGTDDDAVPYQGGKGKLDPSGADFYSAEQSIRAWIKANDCDLQPTTDDLPDTVEDGTKSVRKSYRSRRDGTEVVLITVEGGGHTWPGREFGPELQVLGKSSKDFSANDLMWQFFEKHPKK